MSPRAAWRLETLGFREVYDYVAGKKDWLDAALAMQGAVEQRIQLGRRARPDVPTCRFDERVGEVAKRVRANGWDQAAVTNQARVLLGWLDAERLDSSPDSRVEDAMLEGPVTFRPSMVPEETAQWMDGNQAGSVLVTSSDGTLIGVARREDLH